MITLKPGKPIVDKGHFYDKETGESRHTIQAKNGNMRATTLRDAKKYGWLPSVTTIFKVLSKKSLEDWKMKQVAWAALTLPHLEGEDDEAYVNRIIVDAFTQVTVAADLGTEVHQALELHFRGKPYDKKVDTYVEAVDAWVKLNKITFLGHEIRICDPHGYAGTTDAKITTPDRPGVIGCGDFKTRKSKPGEPMKPYSTEPMQIGAYAKPLGAEYGVNVYISTTEPGRIEASWYEKDQLEREYQAFLHVLEAWKHFNNWPELGK